MKLYVAKLTMTKLCKFPLGRVLLGISLFLTPAIASAFTLNSSSNSSLKGWAGGDVKLMVNTANCPSGVDVEALVQAAVGVWNDVPTSTIKVSYGGTTTSTGSMTNPPTVYCATSFAAIPGSPDPNAVPGAASVSAATGTIDAGQIFLNATAGQANIGNLSDVRRVLTMAHEIGHLLGLGHSPATSALMYYDITSKTELRLSQDDIDGMSYLYPSDEFSESKFAGCGLVKNITPPPPSTLGCILALFLIPLVVGLRLRRLRDC